MPLIQFVMALITVGVLLWLVNRYIPMCPPKIEMSSSYQSRNVRFVDINNHQGLQEASGGSAEFGKGDRAPLTRARFGALECRSGLSRL